MRATLHSSQWLSRDVREVILSPHKSLNYRPGQYISIARTGREPRCYSMARAPSSDNRIALHVRRWPGGSFSDVMMNESRIGDEFDITGPLGAFAFPEGAGPVVMLATGTGIAPFLAMLESVLAGNAMRPITLYWGMRNEDDFYARHVVGDWTAQFQHFRFVPVLSELGSGYVQDLAAREIGDPANTHVLACGNARMTDDAFARFVTGTEIPVASFASDAFVPAKDGSDAAETGPDSEAKSAVRLFINGQCLHAPAGETLLRTLKVAAIPVMSVCGGKASCGTCLVELDADWSERVPPCSRTERNLLSCLPDTGPLSRLSCQIRVTQDLDGLAVRLSSYNPTTKEFSV
ncbi:MAG: flavin reductase family protein [Paraburkholderia sp.]|nr:flavin reductase family protein [Paraburkholderia sp.]MDE1180969.1 flavin reductase family protein [Paraburkholderia sp.]